MKQLNKILILFLILNLFLSPACLAFWGKPKKNPLDFKEKVEYLNINWWNNFSDDYLKCYILQAIKNNHDAKKASWKVEEYRQFVRYQLAQELPSFAVGGDYIGVHFPQSVRIGTGNNIFAVPFTTSYEADIFLKNRDKTRSKKKEYESEKFREKSIYISLASDVATAYINVIKLDKQICLQKKIVAIKKEALEREKARYERGVTSIPKFNDVKKEYKSTNNDLNDLIKSRDKTLTQLAVLIGESPQNITEFKRGSFDKFEYTSTIPQEISSDVVFSRPDIMAAEADLKKAKIDIRIARKEFLPKINIFGIYAFSNIGSSFFSWDDTFAAIVAGLTQDIFKGGMKIANLRISKSKYEQLFEAYKQADLNALKEVNDSMLMIKEDTKTDRNTNANLALQFDNYKRAVKSYDNGIVSYTELLAENETLLSMKQNRVNSKTSRLIDYITLYKAVGGKL